MTERAPKPSLLSRITMYQWLALALTVVAVIFIVENRDHVEIRFLPVTVSSPMWLILLIMFLIGLVAGLLLGRRSRR
ncbi:LapA family protein [Nocardia sp. NBC_01329]|uniref:LapA family protein n=1 Tax=Nocardia sp. NBC_01329 TaxID=2903594 RepID=UPI002E14A657|nr:LapA family protein [Nocardia sp. NBC_01329]